jgi:hypothetical protein
MLEELVLITIDTQNYAFEIVSPRAAWGGSLGALKGH